MRIKHYERKLISRKLFYDLNNTDLVTIWIFNWWKHILNRFHQGYCLIWKICNEVWWSIWRWLHINCKLFCLNCWIWKCSL